MYVCIATHTCTDVTTSKYVRAVLKCDYHPFAGMHIRGLAGLQDTAPTELQTP